MSFLGRATLTREEFLSLFHSGGTLQGASFALGLSDEEMGLALLEAQHAKKQARDRELLTRRLESTPLPPPPNDRGKVFCTQCDRLVKTAEMVSCRSRFCDGRKAA